MTQPELVRESRFVLAHDSDDLWLSLKIFHNGDETSDGKKDPKGLFWNQELVLVSNMGNSTTITLTSLPLTPQKLRALADHIESEFGHAAVSLLPPEKEKSVIPPNKDFSIREGDNVMVWVGGAHLEVFKILSVEEDSDIATVISPSGQKIGVMLSDIEGVTSAPVQFVSVSP